MMKEQLKNVCWQKLKADEQLYNALRATELIEEMEDKVEAYRQRYNK